MALDREGFKERLEGYVAGVAAKHVEHFRVNGYTFAVPSIEVEYGPKYVKVWKIEKNAKGEIIAKSIHTFVNRENGDILRAATYKAPAKNGVRGNVFDRDYGLACVNHHGAIYLR